MDKIKQDAGRRILGEFSKKFAHYNDDILFGENWADDGISLKERSIITVVILIASGIFDSSLEYHLKNCKTNGVSQKEISSIITHIAFYAGWPKAWAAFNIAKNIWDVSLKTEDERLNDYQKTMFFPIGEFNEKYKDYFTGKSYLEKISTQGVSIFNVTFEPGCRNNWHIHNAKDGGGQILICVAGVGYYMEEGKEAIKLVPGDSINIKPGVKHWHGAAKDSYFSHLAIEVPGVDTSTTWLEPVSEEIYSKLK